MENLSESVSSLDINHNKFAVYKQKILMHRPTLYVTRRRTSWVQSSQFSVNTSHLYVSAIRVVRSIEVEKCVQTKTCTCVINVINDRGRPLHQHTTNSLMGSQRVTQGLLFDTGQCYTAGSNRYTSAVCSSGNTGRTYEGNALLPNEHLMVFVYS